MRGRNEESARRRPDYQIRIRAPIHLEERAWPRNAARWQKRRRQSLASPRVRKRPRRKPQSVQPSVPPSVRPSAAQNVRRRAAARRVVRRPPHQRQARTRRWNKCFHWTTFNYRHSLERSSGFRFQFPVLVPDSCSVLEPEPESGTEPRNRNQNFGTLCLCVSIGAEARHLQ